MKPIEIVFRKTEHLGYEMEIYYSAESDQVSTTRNRVGIDELPVGFKLNRHYSITDLYGYGVIDDKGE